jgi:NADPH:quinone reductase-like Zn-dependent oxidoreductase/NADP-dependent 3-hydroxy acid dehydrogenase YdfG/acyl carrier protein
LPAAAIIDMALAVARIAYPEATVLELRDVELLRPMGFDDRGAREVRSALLPDGDWQMTSRKRLADEPMTVHATARIAAAVPGRLLSDFDLPGEQCIVKGAELYRCAARLGLDYGESFRTVREVIVTGSDRATVALVPTALAVRDSLISPTLLDGALQGLLALLFEKNGQKGTGFLPRRFGRVRTVGPFGRIVRRAELCLTRRGTRSASADIALYDDANKLVAELADCGFVQVDLGRSAAEDLLRIDLLPAPLGPVSLPEVLDRLSEILLRVVAAQDRDPRRETDQALLFDALLAGIGLDVAGDGCALPLPGPLLALLRRHSEDDLPDSGELWRRMLADYPELVTELALVAMLKQALRDGVQRAELASPMIAALRQASPPAVAGKTVIDAALDEIAAQWPCERPLRIREVGATRLCDRLHRFGLSVLCVGDGEPYDIAVCAETGTLDPWQLRTNLAPGAALLAVMPLPNPFWELVVDPVPEWRAELAAAGFVDIGSAPVSLGPWPCQVIWARAPAEPLAAIPTASLSLGLIADGVDVAFAEALETAGHHISPDETVGELIILAVGGDGEPVTEATRLLPLFARVARIAAERQVPLWLVTSGKQQPSGDAGLVGAATWGFGRVLRNELPGLTLRLIDLPPGMPWAERAQLLVQELAATSADAESVWTPIGRHVLRLRRGVPSEWARPDDAIVASYERPGRLEQLGWSRAQTRPLRPGEIEIEVRAAGVNFRDVMAATGVLPEEALLDGFAGVALGLECAGIVSAVGEGVERITVGDRVAGFAPAAIAGRVVTRADAVMAIPRDISFAAAATLPVAFVTARYSLDTLAQLMPGESVLIHAASGGVGLAAIQIAKARGATVIATAGSPEKRAFLHLAGADHVCDSRELRFVAKVREATEGTGVDVVLNSLHGEAMEASLELLKPFGRFIELGKRDFYENRRLQSRLLRQNVSYFAVDVDQLPVQRPELARSLLGDVGAALAAGEIRPLAHRCFTFAETADAFRLMRAAQHIGKLVLVADGNAGIIVSRGPDLAMRRDGIYIVTGGLGGFGFATARWLVEQGAGHLALIGRRGIATPGVAAGIAELQELGATVSVHTADVADLDGLAAALDAIRCQSRPIRGIVHAAAEIVDGLATTLSPSDVESNLHAKLGGALLLDRLTKQDPLDLFWLFSSATTMIGAPGQGAYVAANHALEALARRRHAEGKPALAIAWGPIADTGALADRPAEREALNRRLGALPMTASRALSALPAMVASGLPVVALADVRWGEVRHALPALTTPFFDDVRSTPTDPVTDGALLVRLAGLDAAECRDLLAKVIADEAARILRLPARDIDGQRPLAEFGMDSLMAIELRLALEARLCLDLPLMSLADGTTIATLAAHLAKLLARPAQAEPVVELAARYEVPLDPFALGGLDLAAEE